MTYELEAAGIEPSRDSGVTANTYCYCVNGQHRSAAYALQLMIANRQESATDGTHCQSVLPPTVVRIAELWSSLPPHVREAIQTLVDVASPFDETASPMLISERSCVDDKVVWNIAQQCRSIVQNCLREEEWQDADEEFFEVIRNGLFLGT